MRIVLIIPYNPLQEISGLELITLRLAGQFQRQGHPVIILSKGRSGVVENVEILGFPDIYKICQWLLVNHKNYDIVQWMEIFPDVEEMRPQFIFSLLLRRILKKEVLLMVATSENMRRRGGGSGWRCIADKSFSSFVVYNDGQIDEFIKCGFQSAKIHLLASGIDTRSMFTPIEHDEKSILRKNIGINSNKCVVLYIGRFVDRKRPDFLLDIWEEMTEIQPYADLLMIGSGEGHVESIERKIIQKASMIPGVRCIPTVMDTWNYYRCVDIVVIPSVREGEPVVLLEAMACGLPVVASRIQGTIKMIVDKETGILCEPNNKLDFQNAIRYLINNPGERFRIGQLARKRVCAERDIVDVSTRYLDLYHVLLSGSIK